MEKDICLPWVIKTSSLSYRYRPEAPININENLPIGTKLAKFTATDRDIADTVYYEFIGTQKEFAINEGIITFIVSHFRKHSIKYFYSLN